MTNCEMSDAIDKLASTFPDCPTRTALAVLSGATMVDGGKSVCDYLMEWIEPVAKALLAGEEE